MWFQKPHPSEMELQRLLDLVDSQARHIHRLETALARATHTTPPEPFVPPSRSHSTSSTPSRPSTPPRRAPLGAESVSIMTREVRQDQEHQQAVRTAFKLPRYMEAPTVEGPIPDGKSVGGGFSTPPSESPPDKNPPSGSPSTES